MKTSYKILFLIELLHEYYRNLQCKDFNIIPSADTALQLKHQQVLFKMAGNKFIALVKVNDDNQPVVPIDPQTKFRFYLDLINPHFTTITRLDQYVKPRPRLWQPFTKPRGYTWKKSPSCRRL